MSGLGKIAQNMLADQNASPTAFFSFMRLQSQPPSAMSLYTYTYHPKAPIRHQRSHLGCLMALLMACCSPIVLASSGYQPELVPGIGFFVSNAQLSAEQAVVIRNANILTGTNDELERTDLLIIKGRIARIGAALKTPANTLEIDGSDKWLTPGLIDLGFGFPDLDTEAAPALYWPMPDINNYRSEQIRALSGGVTTLLYRLFRPHDQITDALSYFSLAVPIHNVPYEGIKASAIAGVPPVLSMRCPSSSLGWHQLRQLLRQAKDYANGQHAHINEDLNLLAGAMRGELGLHLNCSSRDALLLALDVAQYFGLTFQAMTEASEAYKIISQLVQRNICTSLTVGQNQMNRSDTGELKETNVLAISLITRASGRKSCTAVQSGGSEDFGQLHLLAGRAQAQANSIGIHTPPRQAIAWLTSIPAKILGIDEYLGSIERGKLANLVLWSGNPFSTFTRAEKVLLGGRLVWDLQQGGNLFELDQNARARIVRTTSASNPQPDNTQALPKP